MQKPMPPLQSPTRRTALKAGLALGSVAVGNAADAALAPGSGWRAPPSSPATTPFLQAMPIIPVLQERPLTDPGFAQPPTTAPNRAINPATGLPYEGRGESHQYRSLAEPQHFYVQHFGAVPAVSIHPQLQPQVNFWGANLGGADLTVDKPTTPMPTIVTRYQAGANTAVLVRRFNNLPTGAASGGFGKNQISTHLHNFHSAPDSDGGPCDPNRGSVSESPTTQGRFFFPGQYYDYYYNMKRAGFTNAATPDGDVRESLGTLWYHDHREGHTAENVYKGLAGFHLIFNEYDTGSETTGFKLPSYPQYDIPMIFTDVRIDPNTGQAAFDTLDIDGHLGDKYMVNGKIQPYFNVSKRRYRFRLLDQGPSRFYQLYLTNPDNTSQSIPFWRIMNDGNLLPKPLQTTSVLLSVAERADIIVDFAKITAVGGPAPGATRLWLENRLLQTDGIGPETSSWDGSSWSGSSWSGSWSGSRTSSWDTDRTGLNAPGDPNNVLVEFRIGAAVADASADPATITSFSPISLPPLGTSVITRTFNFDEQNGQWVVNGYPLSCDVVRFAMKRGTTETWVFQGGRGWSHPIHGHGFEGRITKRNGTAIPSGNQEYARKDVVRLGDRDSVEFVVKATDYVGVFPMHCHNVVHEDHAMMLLFAVNDVGDSKTAP
jgi:FtsP/CotA-like multicopper oxidase with cupredoxin domain